MSEQLADAVTAEIRRLLDERGWSGRELSRRADIKPTAMADKLAGRSPFDLVDLDRVCAALEVDPGDLIGWARKR